MNAYISLASLSMDLKRVAMASHRNSKTVSDRFLAEALERKKELDKIKLKPYIMALLDQLEDLAKEIPENKAEIALFLSTLLQNAAVKNKAK